MNYLFSAKWCPQCETVKKQIDLKALNIAVIDVDTDSGMELADSLGVVSLPTFVNEVGEKLYGVVTEAKLKEFLCI